MSCAGPDPAGHPDVRVHRRAQPPLATTLVVTETSMSTATAQTSLVFDQANRLRTYGSSATYTYDGDGLRQSKTVGGVNEPFVWDASAGIPLLLMDGSTAFAPTTTPQPTVSVPLAEPSLEPTLSATPLPATPSPSPRAVPTATPFVVRTAAPIVTRQPVVHPPPPTPAASYSCGVTMSNPTPGRGGSETAHITSNVPNATATLVARYKTTDSTYSGTTNSAGNTDITFGIGHPTAGYTVRVDVNVGGKLSCSSSVTPQ